MPHPHSGEGLVSFAAHIAGQEAFRSPERRAGQPAATVTAPLQGATAFTLQIRKSGPDVFGAWADGRIELEDGRTLRLSDLPIQPLGGL